MEHQNTWNTRTHGTPEHTEHLGQAASAPTLRAEILSTADRPTCRRAWPRFPRGTPPLKGVLLVQNCCRLDPNHSERAWYSFEAESDGRTHVESGTVARSVDWQGECVRALAYSPCGRDATRTAAVRVPLGISRGPMTVQMYGYVDRSEAARP